MYCEYGIEQQKRKIFTLENFVTFIVGTVLMSVVMSLAAQQVLK